MKLPTTAVRGQRQYNNKALLTTLTGRPDTDFLWHKAVSAWLPAKEILTLLTHPKLTEMNALIKLDQLVLQVHRLHDDRVTAAAPTAPPASKTRKATTCTYCGGKAQPAHGNRATCPKRMLWRTKPLKPHPLHL